MPEPTPSIIIDHQRVVLIDLQPVIFSLIRSSRMITQTLGAWSDELDQPDRMLPHNSPTRHNTPKDSYYVLKIQSSTRVILRTVRAAEAAHTKLLPCSGR